MRELLWVLIRSLVIDFYNSYAGFFLILVLFAFGIMRPVEHIYILQEAAHSPGLLLFLLLIWTAYLLMVCQYSMQVSQDISKHFLRHTILLDKRSSFLAALVVHSLLMMPVLIYVAATTGMALYFGQWKQLIILLLYIVLSYLPGFIIFRGYGFLKQYRLDTWLKLRSRNIHLPAWLFFFPFLLNQHLLRLILTKAIALLVLQVTFLLYEREVYDQRLLLAASLTAALINSPMLIAYLRFLYGPMSFSLGLPLSRLRRISEMLLISIIILIPESMLLLVRSSFTWVNSLFAVCMLCAIPVLFFSLQLAFPTHQDKQTRRFFAGFVLLFLLVIYSVPSWLIACFILVISAFLFFRYCYQYEYVEEY
jgi:hypothetical protein